MMARLNRLTSLKDTALFAKTRPSYYSPRYSGFCHFFSLLLVYHLSTRKKEQIEAAQKLIRRKANERAPLTIEVGRHGQRTRDLAVEARNSKAVSLAELLVFITIRHVSEIYPASTSCNAKLISTRLPDWMRFCPLNTPCSKHLMNMGAIQAGATPKTSAAHPLYANSHIDHLLDKLPQLN
ncbi:hypothetical protein MY3957_001481 [Beauveria namnaoensis]